MSAPVQNPATPHLQPLPPGGCQPGTIVHVTGTFTPGAASLIIKLQQGAGGEPSGAVGLCVYGRVREGRLGRNSFLPAQGWGQEETTDGVAGLAPGRPFDVAILCDPQCFKIALNGQHVCQYNHRTNPASLDHLNIGSLPGDLSLSCVWVEQPQQQAYAPPPPAYAPPVSSYGPPSAPPGGYAPPPGMNQSQGGYAPPPGMNQSQGGYAPPPGMNQPQMPPQYPGAPGYDQYYGSQNKNKGLPGALTDAASKIFNKANKFVGGTSTGGGYPPQGGAYPPQGGAYPPQGGAYPPQGGAYPPQGGAYPQAGQGGPW